MSDKRDIKCKYQLEIDEINNKLIKIEKGQIYELTNLRGDGFLSTNISDLRKMLNELFYKIDKNKDSNADIISEMFSGMNKKTI